MIRLHDVHKTFRGRREVCVLRGVDLAVDGGQVALISGATGAGKSTLLALLYGELCADAGTVEVLGRDVARLRRASVALLRRRVGVVTQQPLLVDDRTALANVALALDIAGLPARETRVRAALALGTVGLACEADVPVRELSLGQRQRVALARAIAIEPAVLVADEPTAHLDWATPLVRLVDKLQSLGAAAVITSNDPRLWNAAAARGWYRAELSGGALRDVIAAADVTGRPAAGHGGITGVTEPTADTSDDAAPNVVPFPLTARHA